MAELTPIIKESFLQFSGAVLQSRALPDARDNLKPSARQIFYCLYTDKFVHEKPFQKTLKAIGSAFRMYIHGDSSAEGIIMRAGQSFAMRYPLVEVEGSSGTLIAPNSWSAPRYTSSRLSELSNYLFRDIDKETIEEWRDNYDDTEKYPMTLPSKGFFNVVNGAYGIGVGASCSIPQYNLKEVNEALIKLLWNPKVGFNEIYCAPDFATGGVLLNNSQVKESHENGRGAACKIRSVIEYDEKENCLIITEIPYMVYTETLCKQLEEIINNEDGNPGIIRFNDLTALSPLIKVYLEKKVNPQKVIHYLYKNTSLQTYYGVNFTVLENGRFPRVYGWQELLLAHLEHEIEVYTRGFEFDLRKIRARLRILEALMKAYDAINEVIHTIKSAASTQAANMALRRLLSIDEEQAKAILDLKLARLSKLDIEKLREEQRSLLAEEDRISAILADETLLKREIEKGLREVAEKFGDARRTKILDLQEDTEGEVIEVKRLSISFTNKGNAMAAETSTLLAQRRNTVGTKFKLSKGEFVVDSVVGDNVDEILFFTDCGNFYHCPMNTFDVGERIGLNGVLPLDDKETVTAAAVLTKESQDGSILFLTQHGFMKKSSLSDYNLVRGNGAKAISLEEGDRVAAVMMGKIDTIGILTKAGNFAIMNAESVRETGRVTKGVIAMKLDDGDVVVAAHPIAKGSSEILSVSSDGLAKRTTMAEFTETNRGAKGRRIQAGENFADFVALSGEKIVNVVGTVTQITIAVDDVPLKARNAVGVKLLKLKDDEKVQCLCL